MANDDLVKWGFLALVGIIGWYLLFGPGAQTQAVTQPPIVLPPSTGGGSSLDGSIDVCDKSAKTTLTNDIEAKFSPTTSMTNEYSRILVNGVDKGLYADGATLTVAPEDMVTVYYAFNSSLYYNAKQAEAKVPCKGAVSTSDLNGEKYKVYDKDDGLTITIINPDGTTANTISDSETVNVQALSAGDLKTFKMRIQPVYQDGLSPEKEPVVRLMANTSAYDKLTLVGDGVKDANCPSSTIDPVLFIGQDRWCYSIPSFLGEGTERQYEIVVDVDDNNPPTASGASTGSNITVTVFDQSWYKHSKTGEYLIGLEDDQNVNVGIKESPLTTANVSLIANSATIRIS